MMLGNVLWWWTFSTYWAAEYRCKGDFDFDMHTPRRLHNKSEATCLHLGVLYYRVLFCLNFYFEERINTNTMYDVECKAVAAIQTICIAMVHVLFFQLYISVIGHRWGKVYVVSGDAKVLVHLGKRKVSVIEYNFIVATFRSPVVSAREWWSRGPEFESLRRQLPIFQLSPSGLRIHTCCP